MNRVCPCSCKVGPGKFEGEGPLAFMACQMLSFADTSTGDDGNLVDWFRAPLNFDTDGADKEALEYGYCLECVNEALAYRGSLALWEDSLGFVYCRTFDTQAEFDAALNEAIAEEEVE